MSERLDLVIVASTVLTPSSIAGERPDGRVAVAVRDGLIAGLSRCCTEKATVPAMTKIAANTETKPIIPKTDIAPA